MESAGIKAMEGKHEEQSDPGSAITEAEAKQ